ncbi:hypothetical protein [Streptomyces sp. NBC_00009]|uniref:hypothetical protein n=1 Tax=Streptomyces sp. NBC_00009 TaxID=2975620 RepID=UPI003253E4E4
MPSSLSQRGAHVVEARWRLTLLAQGVGGWARLCRIVSTAHTAPVDGVPVAACPVFQEHLGEGLVSGRPDLAERLLAPWRTIAGPGLRLEVLTEVGGERLGQVWSGDCRVLADGNHARDVRWSRRATTVSAMSRCEAQEAGKSARIG